MFVDESEKMFFPVGCMLKKFCFSDLKVYLAEITADTQTCAKRNVHGRSLKDIMKVCRISYFSQIDL